MSNVFPKPSGPSVADLNVWLDGAEVKVSCRIREPGGGDWMSRPSVPLNLDRAALANKIAQIKEILPANATTVWASLEDPLAAPKAGVVAEEFKSCMERTISEGSALFTQLSDNGLKTILKKLNEMPDGSRLSINTDCAFFPWEILYPLSYSKDYPPKIKEANPPRSKLLWGYRFIVNYNLLPGEDEGWELPVDEHEKGPVFVSINLNPTIAGAFVGRPFKPIEAHQTFFKERFADGAGDIWQTGEEIVNQLLSTTNQATIIYLYCHGSSSVPFSAGMVEQLEFDDATRIQPSSLNFPNTYARGPIVILNSCSSAAQSPLSFSSFHSTFRKKGAMGIIGTTIQIPATFAAAFGMKLIENYLAGVPIGVAIFRLRQELILNDNPLGLFYSLQCPIEITAPKAGK